VNLFEKLKSLSSIPPFFAKRGHFVVDDLVGISLLTATSYYRDKGKYLIVVSNLYKAQQICSFLQTLVGKDNVFLFPCDELIRAETMAQSKEMVAHRLYVLSRIISNNAPIVVANLASATRYLPDIELFSSQTKTLKVGDVVDIEKLKKELVIAGYLRVNRIDQSLQFAIRGDIIDIFSVNQDNPVRIELFGDEIESIRYFDLAKQTSIEEIKEITLLPANDILLSEKELKAAFDKVGNILEKDQAHLSPDQFEILRDNVDNDISNLLEGNIDQRLYKYFGFLSDKHFSIFDYCKDYTKIIVDKSAIDNSN
jgi:transcription-repair coupling factor (superfamily II helicase)